MTIVDPFVTYSSGLSSPARRHFAITPDDDNDLAILPREIYCTVAGNVSVRDEGGTDLTYPMLQGDRLPFRAVRILAATTATVVGWY